MNKIIDNLKDLKIIKDLTISHFENARGFRLLASKELMNNDYANYLYGIVGGYRLNVFLGAQEALLSSYFDEAIQNEVVSITCDIAEDLQHCLKEKFDDTQPFLKGVSFIFDLSSVSISIKLEMHQVIQTNPILKQTAVSHKRVDGIAIDEVYEAFYKLTGLALSL